MEQRDIIKDQIEQLGRVLGKIVNRFLNLDSSGNITDEIKTTNQQLKSELDIDLDKIIYFTKNELRDFIKKRNFAEGHLEQLSEFAFKVGKNKIENNKDESKAYLTTALELLEVADDISQMLSLDRVHRKNEIQSLINEIL